MKLVQLLVIVAALAVMGCGHTLPEVVAKPTATTLGVDGQVRLLQLNPFVPNETKASAVKMLRGADLRRTPDRFTNPGAMAIAH